MSEVETGTGVSEADHDADGDADTDADDEEVDPFDELPSWEDEYLETLARRLMYNYDLEKDFRVEGHGERFPLYGRMELTSQKHFLHPSLSFAHHVSHEHLFVRRVDRVGTADLERLVEVGHALADEWIEANEDHYCTEFTFGIVASAIDDDVRAMVAGLDERTLLKLGYYGHYEVNLVVVAPEARDIVANEAADVEQAFRTWDEIERTEPGLLQLISRRLQL